MSNDTLAATAAGLLRPAIDFPLPVDSYHDEQIPSLFGKLTGRIQREPLNLVATGIFCAAIIHMFDNDPWPVSIESFELHSGHLRSVSTVDTDF